MSHLELTEALLAKLAGWEAMKQARAMLETGRVISSFWEAPLLRGVVQDEGSGMRAGLVIKSDSDAENMCPCRQSRQYGMICAHSVAIGLHEIRKRMPTPKPSAQPSRPAAPTATAPTKPVRTAKALLRTGPEDDGGEPLEIHVILPPNFAEAVTRGRVMLCLEASWNGKRAPLSALPMNRAFRVGTPDAALLDFLEQLNGGDTPAMAMLSATQFTQLLPKIAGHPRVSLGKSQSVEIAVEPARLEVRATLEPSGEIVCQLAQPTPQGLIRGATLWIFQNHSLRPLGLPAAFESLLTGPLRLPRSRVPQVLNVDWPQLTSQCDVRANFSLDDFVVEPAMPKFKLHLAGGLAALQAKLECSYGDKPVLAGTASGADLLWIPDPQSPTRYRTRHFEAEEAALGRLLRYGFSHPDGQGTMKLASENLILKFFAREFPRLEKEWAVTLEERLNRSARNIERIEPRFEITPSGEQWFDLSVAYESSGGEKFSAADIQRLILSGQSHTRLRNGKTAVIDTGAVEELSQVLTDCDPRQHANGFRVSQVQAGFLDATLREHTSWKINAPTSWTQRVARQRGEIKLEAPPLGELESVLRPYQKDGVAWLRFLRTNGFGGILADEMGLGKTAQALAALKSVLDERAKKPDGAQQPALVVCPTSLVSNWGAEAAKFAPGLRTLLIQGPRRRALFAKIAQQDLVVTSYALLRRDADSYRDLDFDTVILDEAQHIKNRQTQNAQAVKSIRARHRLVLTGTPMENSVLDLWSIFDFLMPGYLGTATDFRERYEIPLTRDKNAETQARLARRVRPFVLRRMKREVASDLPDKIEQISFCELTDGQRSLYRQVLEAGRREILDAAGNASQGKSRMLALTTLLRLRQICCDPRLLESTIKAAGAESSGKVELFGELLEETLDGGHRALVFSQFTSMLHLLGKELEERDIEYCYLDGSTRDRAAVVDKFQRDDRVPVFLISLKAGGVGLNLTGADTVIHFDPWWNPAVEAQATDRAHRIGQKRVVTSYKLIARDTVEEKILHLQARKRALIQGMLGEDQFAESLSWEEIQDLLTE
jgi:SNF2 family DNA or RNA helicase